MLDENKLRKWEVNTLLSNQMWVTYENVHVDFLSERDVELLTKFGLPENLPPGITIFREDEFGGYSLYDWITQYQKMECDEDLGDSYLCVLGTVDGKFLVIDSYGTVCTWDVEKDDYTFINSSLSEFFENASAFKDFLTGIQEKYGENAWTDSLYNVDEVIDFRDEVRKIDKNAINSYNFWGAIITKMLENNKSVISREKLLEFLSGEEKLRIVTVDGGLLRNKGNYAFYVAQSNEDFARFKASLEEVFSPKEHEIGFSWFNAKDIYDFNVLFDDSYAGFLFVCDDLFVPETMLYSCREEVVEWIKSLYENDGCIYAVYDDNNNALAENVDNIPVAMNFFTSKEEALATGKGEPLPRVIEQWISNKPNFTTIFSIDGKIVFGREIREAVYLVWREYMQSTEKVKEILEGKELHILAADDGSGAIMRQFGIPIFFLTEKALSDYAYVNRNVMTHEFFDMTVKDPRGILIAADGCDSVFIDVDEGRYVCFIEDVLEAYKDPSDTTTVTEMIRAYEKEREELNSRSGDHYSLVNSKDEEEAEEPEEEKYSDIPIPENNVLKELISEFMEILDEKAAVEEDDDHDDPLWNTEFSAPATEEEMTAWEEENNIQIPELFKEWLRFSGRCTIDGFKSIWAIKNFGTEYIEGYVVVGELVGDGEALCFDKETGEFISHFEGEISHRFGTFDNVIKYLIDDVRCWRPESEQEFIDKTLKSIERITGLINSNEKDEEDKESLIEYRDHLKESLEESKKTMMEGVDRGLKIKEAFDRFFDKNVQFYQKEFKTKPLVSYQDDINKDLIVSGPDEDLEVQWEPILQKEKIDFESLEEEFGFKFRKELKQYFSTYRFAPLEGAWKNYVLRFEGVGFDCSVEESIRRAVALGKEAFPDREILALGRVEIGDDDDYTLYYNNEIFDLFFKHEVKGEDVTFLYTLADVIGNMRPEIW